MNLIAVLHTDLYKDAFGRAIDLTQPLVDRPVIDHTVQRVARIDGIKAIVLLHPKDQDPLAHLDPSAIDLPVSAQPADLRTATTRRLTSGRKWCLTGWRGGLGGATIYDEALPPGPILQAMAAHQADSAVIARADWCLVDPELGRQQVQRHLQAPDQLPIVFTQAAPGLSVVVCHQSALEQLDEHHAGFGQALGYNPKHAHGDPIGKDVCIAVPPEVRDAYARFVFDGAQTQRLTRIAETLGPDLIHADAHTIVRTAAQLSNENGNVYTSARWATIELTPRRELLGPITPQHHVPGILDRQDMTAEIFHAAVDALSQNPQLPVLLGGLGDALLHPQWFDFTQQAKSKLLGVGLETDLLCDVAALDQLIAADVDVINVRLNADRPEVYTAVNGQPLFDRVMSNLQYLINGIRARNGRTWISPSFVKVTANLIDLESFYERWKTITHQAVIERFACGVDADFNPLIDDQSPVNMTPPAPVKWPTNHLTVLSHGTVTNHRQDWLGLHPLDHLAQTPLAAGA